MTNTTQFFMGVAYEGIKAHASRLIHSFTPVPPESYHKPPRLVGTSGKLVLIQYYYDGFFYALLVWNGKYQVAREMGPSWKIQDRVTEKYNPRTKKYQTERACYSDGQISSEYIAIIEQHFTALGTM